ncbi:peptide ABC transporter permease [Ignicoccus islandicus DSM 13165]|uniref:Peptide ABC transporter permease n=1 Tax=Ignicoccus islandicus DSM 13165 TaxID=940295 RepID=A0A0U3FPA2_9CREN|nr:ABC transporter permease [Ignicoccus islandicus]ALU11799.1 peptide ABC transporter permease [Ignicoccus islandicus DSM 13165]
MTIEDRVRNIISYALFGATLILSTYNLYYSLPLWVLLVIYGFKTNRSLTTFLLTRVIDALIVLLAVLVITVAMFSGTIAEIKKEMIIDNIKRSVMSNPQLVQKLGEHVKEYIQETAEKIIKAQGLDRPWYENLPAYLSGVVTLDLKSQILTSNSGSRVVRDIIMERLPKTVLLFTTSTIVTIVIGIVVGMIAAKKRGSLLDKLVTVFAMITASFPMWWVGMIMIQVFAYALNVFPSGGMHTIPPPSGIDYYLDLLWHMALPLMTIVLVSFGGWAYVTRNILLGTLKEDFVLAAKARGLLERTVLIRHVLRPSLPPIVTIMALSLLASLTGAIITEIVFNWPGMGMLFWEAIETLDVPVILGLTYVSTLLFVVTMLILDIVYAILDPRVRR